MLRALPGKATTTVASVRQASPRQPLSDIDGADPSWHLLSDLGALLTQSPDPDEELPRLCRWLAESLGHEVAIVLTEGQTVTRVVACPGGSVAEGLEGLLGKPLPEPSAMATVLAQPRARHVASVENGTAATRGVPSALPPGMASAALAPLVAPGGVLGVLAVHSSEPGRVDERLTPLVAEMAARLALVLANARVRRALSRLEDAQETARLREELLAALSHDMQTPLAVLLGSIKALQAVDDLAPKQRAGLYESMARRGDQLQRLVEQFLDYSRLEAGRPLQVRPSLSGVGDVIARIEADLGWRRPLAVQVPDDLPPAFVDPDRLYQVLTNLTSNALKFSPAGSPIAIRAQATPDAVEIVVMDVGTGMSEAEVARVFEKFHRGAGAEGTPGTGLGLYVSRGVIEAQGGKIEVESQPGQGSRFTVVLPRQPPGTTEPTNTPSPASPAGPP